MKIKLSDNEDNKNLELIEYSNELEDRIDKAIEYIEKLNNILDTLMQDMALLNATGIEEIKTKQVFDRIVMLRGVDKE